MLRPFQILLLASLALVAVSSLAVAAAHASPYVTAFNTAISQHQKAILEDVSTGPHELLPVTCEGVQYEGLAATGTDMDFLLAPTFSSCSWLGIYVAHVDTNNCLYEVHVESGTMDLLCPPEEEIEAVATNWGGTGVICRMWIPPQSGLGPISLSGSGSVLSLQLEIEKTKRTLQGSFLCAIDKQGESTFPYEGSATLKAVNPEGAPLDLALAE